MVHPSQSWQKMNEIHNSLIVGQRQQMVDFINDYGIAKFFPDYVKWLEVEKQTINYFIDAVVSYHRIMERRK